ncbi:MAG: ATP-binding protein [Balneolaceae bacterium]|nr:MAG: ATP-binding protein [Balneolaceae bacterium]
MIMFDRMISELREFTLARLEHYFRKREKAPDTRLFKISGEKGHPLISDIRKFKLNSDEQLLIAIVLAPHLDPDFFPGIIQEVLPAGGDLPIFGSVKGKHHRGFIPTGETALFIIAGISMKKRLSLMKLLSESVLVKQGLLFLEPVEVGEPRMSGKLVLSKETSELYLTGRISLPAFSTDFPARQIETDLSWDDLVLTGDVLAQVEELKTWIEFNDRLLDEWDMRKKVKPGYRVLFSGPPGTGKTLTATLLGKYTGRPVFRIDLSQTVSKYIGETEKNLEKLFSRAENKDWILFFDEADALFGKRTDVSDSHDRYANQEVSYLLQRFESFSGLVILSTNYKANLDDAFLRRFNSIIKFPFPDAVQRRDLWVNALPRKAKLEKSLDVMKIASNYKLSGGNISNIVHWVCLETYSRKSDIITKEQLLLGIKREVEKEGKIFTGLSDTNHRVNGDLKDS